MIPESYRERVASVENMDPDLDVRRRRTDGNCNYIEYEAPNSAGKAKYAPPSPTTSGYSESGSELDNHDSGRASEMEGSPKVQPRRPDTIALGVGLFDPSGVTPATSPEEKTATIKNSEEHVSSRDAVTLSARDFNTLVVSLHDARMRLSRMECKVETLVKALQMQRDESNGAVLKLAETMMILGSDIKSHETSRKLIGNCRPFANSNATHDALCEQNREVQLSCDNNGLSSAPDSGKVQSYECASGSHIFCSLLRKLSLAHQTATSSHSLRTESSSSPLSPTPPAPGPTGSYQSEKGKEAEAARPMSEHINGEVTRNEVAATVTRPKGPVYAVVEKKKNSIQKNGRHSVVADEPLGLQNGVSVKDLEEMIGEGCVSPKDDESFSPSASLTRVSRFSEVDSLMSDNGTPIFEEQSPTVGEHSGDFETLTVETYDNGSSEHSDDSYHPPNERTTFQEKGESEFSLAPGRKDRDSGFAVTSAEKTRGSGDWKAAQHEQTATFSKSPSRLGATNAGVLQDYISAEQHARGSATVAASNSGTSTESEMTETKNKGSSPESKKENVLISNYNRLFKRKGKKKRAESETSFTFVTSPLYEVDFADERNESPKRFERGQSVESIASDKRSPSSRDCSVSLGTSQGDLNSLVSSEDNNNNKLGSSRSLASTQSPANTQLLRLQSGEGFVQEDEKFAGESYDNFNADEQPQHEEDMGPNLVKLAKKAFRNSPKYLRKGKALPNTQTAELKPKSQNGCTVSRIHEANAPSSFTVAKRESQEENSAAHSATKVATPRRKVLRTDDEIFGDDVFIPPRVILTRLQREQADRARFENGRPVAPDDPPPKPSRPGYPHGGHGSPRSSINQHSNGGVPGYPRGMPAVPPKQKIMTPEELTIHEAQEKLRMKQMEEAMLQQTLDQQQKQAAENARWLQQEEQMLSPETPAGAEEAALRRGRGSNGSVADMQGSVEAPPPPNVAPSKPPRKSSRPKDEAAGPRQTKLEEVKTAPTMQLNRDGDDVYKNTMEVVKAVLGMNNMTMAAKSDELFASVKTVGAMLKQLCASLENVLPGLPEDFHREIDMAQRTTNKDLSQVINQLKLVQRFSSTTQVTEYKKCLMAANQVLAIDAKNLLDVVDRARIRKIQNAQEKARAQANDIRQGSTPQASASGYEPEDLYPDGDFL